MSYPDPRQANPGALRAMDRALSRWRVLGYWYRGKQRFWQRFWQWVGRIAHRTEQIAWHKEQQTRYWTGR